MRRALLGAIAGLLVALVPISANAQGGFGNTTGWVTTVCGTISPTFKAGNPGPFTVDVNGNLCMNGTVVVSPSGSTTTQVKATITLGGTFQSPASLAAAATRKGCTLQYVAVAGTVGYVFFGTTSPATDTTTSFQLTNGQAINCGLLGGGVATDKVWITGATNDIFIVSSQ